MGHLSILMWTKEKKYQYTLTDLEFSNFTIFNQEISFQFFFRKLKLIKAPAVIELMTYRFVVNAITNCAKLLSNNFGKGNIHKINILDFIVSIVNTSQY